MKKLMIALFAAMLVISFTIPAMAAGLEYSFNGRVYFDNYIMDSSKEVTGWNDSDEETVWSEASSRLRFNWNMGSLSGGFDMRDTFFNEMWAQWDFGSGQLKFGKIDGGNPTFAPADWELWGGAVGSAGGYQFFGAEDMMQLTVPMGPVTISIAAIEESQSTAYVTGAAGSGDTDTNRPALEASVNFNFGPVAFKVFGGTGEYTEVNTATNKEYDVDSNVIGAFAEFVSGPILIDADVYKAQNGYMGAAYVGAYPVGFDGTNVVDSDVTGWHVGGMYTVNDMFSIVAGYGEVKQERDSVTGLTGGEDTASGWYINLPITITPGFKVVPEYSKDDFEDQTPTGGVAVQEGDVTYVGVQWQIEF